MAKFIPYTQYKQFVTGSGLSDWMSEKPKHSKEWLDIKEEFSFNRETGIFSPKLERLLTEYTKKDLDVVVDEWKLFGNQIEALHQAGIESVKRRWEKTLHIHTDKLVEFYKKGLDEYVKQHKKLVSKYEKVILYANYVNEHENLPTELKTKISEIRLSLNKDNYEDIIVQLDEIVNKINEREIA